MAVAAQDAFSSRRIKNLQESLGHSNEPGWGYFGLAGPLCISDNSLGLGATRKPVADDGDGEPIRNIMAGTLKTGKTPDAYFSFAPPLACGDPYIDPHKVSHKKVEQIDPEQPFRPAGSTRFPLNKRIEYKPHMDSVKDPVQVKEMYKDYLPPRQVLSTVTKKGGNGIYTPGVLFGFGEERKWPEHIPDDYDAPRKARMKELDEHRSKLQEQPFRPAGAYSNMPFSTHEELYNLGGVPSHVPRDKPKPDETFAVHEQPFRPCGPVQGLPEFPEHIPEPSPGGAIRKPPPAEGEERPAFRVGHPRQSCNPMPSVTTLPRNMRAERPSSFMRPVL